MATALKLVKQPAFIGTLPTAPSTTSGMQPAASGSVIGKTSTVDGTLFAGQDIGRTAGAGYTRATT